MEACVAVEREVDKVLTKFGIINEHAGRTLKDVTNHIDALRKELNECMKITNFYSFYFHLNVSILS